MKKAVVFILTIVLLLSFAACGSDDGETTLKNSDVTTTEAEKSTAEEKISEEKTTEEVTTEEETVSEVLTSEDAVTENEESTSDRGYEMHTLPVDGEGMEFTFLSGAGGWRTEMILYPDGSFNGQYSDSELGSNAEEYPNGTVYICDFSGRFTDITKTSDTSFSMTLNDISLKYETDKEWIEDGIRYVASTPYGLEGGKDFIFYLPDASLSEFSDDFLMWWPMRYEHYDTPFETLSCYGIRNLATNDGFFAYEG